MRIAIVSDYISKGGAAVACNRLSEALAVAGHEIRRFVLERGERPANWASGVTFAPEIIGRRLSALIELASAFGCPNASRVCRIRSAERKLVDAISKWRPDVINVHNLHAFSSHFILVAGLAELAPLVWTLHDMWSFTGRCAYSGDCRQFETGCTASCRTVNQYPSLSSRSVGVEWLKRKKFFAEFPQVAAVTPSRWLANEALRGLWKNQVVEVIPNSLDLTIYRPIERAVARAALGLPATKRPHVLLAADFLNESRKGGDMIGSALAACGKEFTLLTLGNYAPGSISENLHTVHLGYVKDERMKALIFSAADLLLHPAPTDNLPNTVIEAFACGTPAVAFKIGGLPEMVYEGITGWLSETVSATNLGKTLSGAIGGEFLERGAIRAFAEENYSLSGQAKAYEEFFQRLKNSRNIGHGLPCN